MESEENEKITNKNLNLLKQIEEEDNLNASLPSLALSEVPSDLIIQTNLIYGKKSSAYKAVLREYSKKTSVHGLTYIFAIHRPFYEKLYWIIFTVISLYLAISYMWETYIKWLDTPTILGFDETLVKIHKIPFPTVTICPENKRDVTKFDFSDVSEFIWSEIKQYNKFPDKEVLTEEYVQQFLATLQTCDQEVIKKFSPFLPTNTKVDVAENLLNMVSDINITMQICKWNGRFDEGCNIIRKVLTNEGVCYQFNGLRPQDIYRHTDFLSYKDKEFDKFNTMLNWSLDYGYRDQGFNAYPKRSIMSSARNGFYALLGSYEDDNDYVCNRFKQGFKVFLNSPDSVPVTTGNYILVPNSHEVMVTVLPQYITSLENLLQFGPEKRQCYFNSERNLRFFKFYTQNNCQTECLTNYTIAKCGCAKFWMPKPFDIPVCDLSKVNCYNNAANELDVIIANQTAQKLKDSNVKIMCDCMPACNSLEYNFEITRAYLDAEATTRAHRENYEDDGSITSRLTVYYRESQFTAIKRTVLYDLTQLIANCGGIFGLFMGISILYWIIALLLSFYLAIYYIWASYVKWSNIPIILGFDETLVKINQIPFPTITICPENQINFINQEFSNISDLIWFEIEEYGNFQNRNNISDEQKLNFFITLQLCAQETIDKYSPYMPKNVNINVAQNLIDLVNDAQTILTFVEFKPDSSGNYLEMVLTNEGVCYQFNGLNQQDIYKNIDYITYNARLENYINVTGNWSLDDGYQNSSDYPKRTSSSSISSGFYLYSLRLRRFKQGFKVFINSPDNIPLTTDTYYIMVPASKQVIVTVLPQYIKTPTNLKDFDIDKRQCYFNKERNLRFFKFYAQNNCQTECLTNYTIAKCGCAKFWMPKPLDIPFCDITQLACCSKASQELDVILTNQTIKKTKDPKVKIMCDCKPACNSLEYNFEITQGYVNINAYLKASRLVEDAGDDYIESDLIVHYKESQFTAIKRTVIYDRTQFIANCGAIFGLFMGGSIISLIEFIYFFSLRLFNNYRRRLLTQKKLKQLEIEILNSP